MLTLIASLAGIWTAATSPATAQTVEDWREVGRDPSTYRVVVDMGSFSGPAHLRTARTVIVSEDASDRIGHMLLHVELDCAARTIVGARAMAFDREGVLLGEQDTPTEPEPVNDGDGTATVLRAACEGAEPDGQRFCSIQAFVDAVRAAPVRAD